MRDASFVILHHRQRDGDHWDLMIEQADGLATWRLDRYPKGETTTIAARRIHDHRKAYLEYEGELSGGRGSVERVDGGRCRILCADEHLWEIQLEGIVHGRFNLRWTHADHWRLECVARGL